MYILCLQTELDQLEKSKLELEAVKAEFEGINTCSFLTCLSKLKFAS